MAEVHKWILMKSSKCSSVVEEVKVWAVACHSEEVLMKTYSLNSLVVDKEVVVGVVFPEA